MLQNKNNNFLLPNVSRGNEKLKTHAVIKRKKFHISCKSCEVIIILRMRMLLFNVKTVMLTFRMSLL